MGLISPGGENLLDFLELHLPKLEKIKDVLPSRQNEAYFR